MSEQYTPTTDEIIRSFTIPGHVLHPRKDGESLGEYLSRTSIEAHGSQMESEAAAHRWLAERDRQVAERAWDECATKAQDLGRLDETAIPWLRNQSPYRAAKGEQK